jgi:hypothetical protein
MCSGITPRYGFCWFLLALQVSVGLTRIALTPRYVTAVKEPRLRHFFSLIRNLGVRVLQSSETRPRTSAVTAPNIDAFRFTELNWLE